MSEGTSFVSHLPLEIPVLDAAPFLLRCFDPRDADLIAHASSDPYIPLISTVPTSSDAELCQDYLERQRRSFSLGFGYSFVIAEETTNDGIGSIGLWLRDIDQGRASTGFWVIEPHRGKGAAKKALHALGGWALLELQIPRLELIVEVWNDKSIEVAESVGFIREGMLRRHEEIGGERHDVYIYSLLADDLKR